MRLLHCFVLLLVAAIIQTITYSCCCNATDWQCWRINWSKIKLIWGYFSFLFCLRFCRKFTQDVATTTTLSTTRCCCWSELACLTNKLSNVIDPERGDVIMNESFVEIVVVNVYIFWIIYLNVFDQDMGTLSDNIRIIQFVNLIKLLATLLRSNRKNSLYSELDPNAHQLHCYYISLFFLFVSYFRSELHTILPLLLLPVDSFTVDSLLVRLINSVIQVRAITLSRFCERPPSMAFSFFFSFVCSFFFRFFSFTDFTHIWIFSFQEQDFFTAWNLLLVVVVVAQELIPPVLVHANHKHSGANRTRSSHSPNH